MEGETHRKLSRLVPGMRGVVFAGEQTFADEEQLFVKRKNTALVNLTYAIIDFDCFEEKNALFLKLNFYVYVPHPTIYHILPPFGVQENLWKVSVLTYQKLCQARTTKEIAKMLLMRKT